MFINLIYKILKWFCIFSVILLIYLVLISEKYLTVPTNLQNLKNFVNMNAEYRNLSYLLDYTKKNRRIYYVNTTNCKMSYVQPYTRKLHLIYTEPKDRNSKCELPIFPVVAKYSANIKRYLLRMRESKLQNNKLDCVYRNIDAIEEPSEWKHNWLNMTALVHFKDNRIVPKNIDAALIACFDMRRQLHKDIFTFLHPKESNSTKPTKVQKPNVIMLGLDTMSRVNLRRLMPKLTKYLDSTDGWYELEGYNKIADTTMPNLNAVLTGMSPEAVRKLCEGLNYLDCNENLSYIWENYTQAGYRTALAIDFTDIHSFNNIQQGFYTAPVDHYVQPHLTIAQYAFQKSENCEGKAYYLNLILNHCLQLVQRYNGTQAYFGLYWTKSFLNNQFHGPQTALEELFLDYLENHYERAGLFENSVVILFSDHGVRFGPMRNFLPDANIEERTPILYIWLPPWLRRKYPNFEHALQENRHRLSSNYDLHLTLQHLLNLENKEFPPILEACPSCQSLLHPLPLDRSCTNAGISEHFCTCHRYAIVPFKKVRPLVPKIIAKINSILIHEKNCQILTLHHIVAARGKLDPANSLKIYRINFVVVQRLAQFEATVLYDESKDILTVNITDISRLTAYLKSGQCISDERLKKYCICNVKH